MEDPPSLADCLIAKDGDEMDLGGLTLRYLAVEGHAPGNVNVHIPDIEALIVSDSLGFRFDRRGFYPLFFTSFSAYVQTIERLKSLRPRILGVPHQGPRRGKQVEIDFDEALRVTHEMKNKILQDGREREEIAKDLFDEYYQDEFLLYGPENILSCCRLLVKRALAE